MAQARPLRRSAAAPPRLLVGRVQPAGRATAATSGNRAVRRRKSLRCWLDIIPTER